MRKLFLIEKKRKYAAAARRLFRRVTEELDMHTVTEVRVLRCLLFDGWGEDTSSLLPDSFFYDAHTEQIVSEEEIRSLAKMKGNACICVIPLFRRPAERLSEEALRMMTRLPDVEVPPPWREESEHHIWFRQADVFLVCNISEEETRRLKEMLINPASAAELPLFGGATPPPLARERGEGYLPITGFCTFDEDALLAFAREEHIRMSNADLLFVRDHFAASEGRDPNRFELRMIDTYWSDHCRHITFRTSITDVEIRDPEIADTFELYLRTRELLYGTRPRRITLMDIATLPMQYMLREGGLSHYAETGEKNAFSLCVPVYTSKGRQMWMLYFKNETHNYSTEREPYLGAFSSFGATIGDPLSARAEVFCAMRLSGLGVADSTLSAEQRMLLQTQMATETADGFAAYGVQSGIPTGYTREWIHPGFSAKHMEACFAAAAAPHTEDFRYPGEGDLIMLVGAKTGRDGLGGGLYASGDRAGGANGIASRRGGVSYTAQIGDPEASRALLRMMRRTDVRRRVIRASDIASGGIAVAAAELAGGVRIDLDRVPTSPSDRTAVGAMMTPQEIAFSETQARMLLVISPAHAMEIAEIAASEDLDAAVIGVVTAERRCRIVWWGRTVLSLSRAFLDTTGAERRVRAFIPPCETDTLYRGISDYLPGEDFSALYLRLLMHPEIASGAALSERFDATAGGGTVFMPQNGERMLTPTGYMAQRFPTVNAGQGETHTALVVSAGYSPRHASHSPYHGAYLSVLEAICRLVAGGIALSDISLSLQEYFPATGEDPTRFGAALSAMLGAFRAQMDYGVAAIGGKDSVNGTKVDMDGTLHDVPPTVITFAVSTAEEEVLCQNAFRRPGSRVYLLVPTYADNGLPDPEEEKNLLLYLHSLHQSGKVHSCSAIGAGGIAAAVAQMCLGNFVGFNYEMKNAGRILLEDRPGAFLLETDEPIKGTLLGYTKEVQNVLLGSTSLSLALLATAYKKPQEKLYGASDDGMGGGLVAAFPKKKHSIEFPAVCISHPTVLLPVLPYQTGEDVLAARFAAVGITPRRFLFCSRTPEETAQSLLALSGELASSDVGILAFAGGSYPGYGSISAAISDPAARFAQAVFCEPRVFDAMLTFCERESHLILGLGEGFRMLLASGIFYGDGITPIGERISLTENPSGHLISKMVRVKTMSVDSPWMRYAESGDIRTLPVASQAGRCVIPGELILDMGHRGEIATQYVDGDGNPTMDARYNPFLSDFAVEGVFARDGRIFGRMAHPDRVDNSLCINVPGNKDDGMFRAAAAYFKIKA